jgi:phage shock protein PspC (stress-responsive transcriptional regulator)
MVSERCTPRDETNSERGDEFRARAREWRREGRRWWERAEAWDPERWKAVAAAWASMWQDAAHGAAAQQQTAAASKACPCCAEEIKQAAIKCKHCGTWLAPPPEPLAHACGWESDSVDPVLDEQYARSRRLARSTGDAMVYGVMSGMGRFFGVDPTWLRIAYAMGTFFTAIIPGVIAYAILAVIIPSDTPGKGQGVE